MRSAMSSAVSMSCSIITTVTSRVRRQLGYFFVEEGYFSAVGRQVAGDEIEKRRLAGAVGADDQAPLPRRDLERDAVDRRQPAEGTFQTRDAKGYFHGVKRSHS